MADQSLPSIACGVANACDRKIFPEHFSPTPRIAVGQYLREHRLASAMIDLSDGLSTDLSHLSAKRAALARWCMLTRCPLSSDSPESLAYALHGGEDYELLFTAPRNRRVPKKIAGVTVTEIGESPPFAPVADVAGKRRPARAAEAERDGNTSRNETVGAPPSPSFRVGGSRKSLCPLDFSRFRIDNATYVIKADQLD